MKRINAVKLIGAMALVLSMAANLALADKPGPKIYPPDTFPYGQSYGQWGDQWWQWAWSMPVTENPLLDETGAWAANGQSGPVWFLAGMTWSYGEPAQHSAVRTVTIPAGKALFFPIANSIWVNLPDFGDQPWSPKQEAFARNVNTKGVNSAYDLSCEIDGWAVKGLADYRGRTPQHGEFMVDIPANDIWGLVGFEFPDGSVFQAGTYGPCVQDGIYLMLAPLAAGQHTIHFAASWSDGNGLDVTYNLTVLE
jgi:hypothetical protein